jgi:hypothetical protein
MSIPRRTALGRASLALGLILASAGMAGAVAFARADVDKDGLVDYKQALIVMPKLKEVSFAKFDTNHDGFINRGEWSGLDAFYTSTYTNRN